MTIHLLSDQVSMPYANFLLSFLPSYFTNKIKFAVVAPDIESKNYWTWVELFLIAKKEKIQSIQVSDQDYFIVLANGDNEHNWFAAFDDQDPSVGFVQTSGWEKYEIKSVNHAIAYHLLTVVTAMMFFGDEENNYSFYHDRSVGCMFDFTGFKSEVIHKLKSAHICPSCMQKLALKSKNKSEALAYLTGVSAVMEEVREKLYKVDLGTIFGKRNYNLIIKEDLSLVLNMEEEEVALPIAKGRETVIFMMLLKYRKGLSYEDFMKPKFLNEYLDLYLKYYVSNCSKESLLRQSKAEMEKGTFKSNLHSSVSKMKTKLRGALKHYKDVNKELEIQSSNGRMIIRINPKYLVNKNRDIDL